jgi:hypothetical protein
MRVRVRDNRLSLMAVLCNDYVELRPITLGIQPIYFSY